MTTPNRNYEEIDERSLAQDGAVEALNQNMNAIDSDMGKLPIPSTNIDSVDFNDVGSSSWSAYSLNNSAGAVSDLLTTPDDNLVVDPPAQGDGGGAPGQYLYVNDGRDFSLLADMTVTATIPDSQVFFGIGVADEANPQAPVQLIGYETGNLLGFSGSAQKSKPFNESGEIEFDLSLSGTTYTLTATSLSNGNSQTVTFPKDSGNIPSGITPKVGISVVNNSSDVGEYTIEPFENKDISYPTKLPTPALGVDLSKYNQNLIEAALGSNIDVQSKNIDKVLYGNKTNNLDSILQLEKDTFGVDNTALTVFVNRSALENAVRDFSQIETYSEDGTTINPGITDGVVTVSPTNTVAVASPSSSSSLPNPSNRLTVMHGGGSGDVRIEGEEFADTLELRREGSAVTFIYIGGSYKQLSSTKNDRITETLNVSTTDAPVLPSGDTETLIVYPDGNNTVDLSNAGREGRELTVKHNGGSNTPTVSFDSSIFAGTGPSDLTTAGSTATIQYLGGQWTVINEYSA